MQVVINRCWGGFSLSKEAIFLYNKLCEEYGSDIITESTVDELDRADPCLIEVVETLGGRANTYCSDLKVVNIPDDVKWEIDEYDGIEKVVEVHRVWY